MADDTAALLRQLDIENADVLGYSMGAGIAMQVAVKHPELVRKLVLVSLSYNVEGFHPGLMEGMAHLKPEDLYGSPFHDEYTRTAPNPGDWATLVEKVKSMEQELEGWTAEDIQSIKAPTLIVMGDSDIVRPEHAVELFRLLGGGVAGDMVGLPNSRLAVLPGTTHMTVVHHAEWLVSMVEDFLGAPAPTA
jgi:pimeloyl-ACP methyl ester carboxylesterase